MKIQIFYKGKDFNGFKKDILNAYNDINRHFQDDLEILVRIHKTKNDFNKQLKRNTMEWEVANASHNNEIDILHPNAMEKESSHNKNEFIPILKHEMTHLFIDKLSNGKTIPKWLDEGFASYLSGQYKIDKWRNNYIEENFCKKLGTPQGWDKHSNYSAYQTASLFVYFLIKNYSIIKVKKMISSLDKNYYYSNFKKIFTKIFKKNLEDLERRFIKELNK